MLQKPFFRVTGSWTASDRSGRRVTRSATGISHLDPEDAERIAKADARRLAEEAIKGITWERRYAYSDRQLVEPVIRRMGVPGTPGAAFISVNGYGSQILNAQQLMFVDVDLPPPREQGLLSRLFRGNKTPRDTADEALGRLSDVVTTDRQLRVRVYRTAAGLRYIFVHRPHEPAAPETSELMKRLGADTKFILLCRVQKCFRARLTPKPWRCGIYAKHPKFDGTTERPDPLYQEWQDNYEKAAAAYATCRFIEEYGTGHLDSALRECVTLHDRTTRSHSGLPLA